MGCRIIIYEYKWERNTPAATKHYNLVCERYITCGTTHGGCGQKYHAKACVLPLICHTTQQRCQISAIANYPLGFSTLASHVADLGDGKQLIGVMQRCRIVGSTQFDFHKSKIKTKMTKKRKKKKNSRHVELYIRFSFRFRRDD